MKSLFLIVIILTALTIALGGESLTLTVDKAVEMLIAQNLALKQSSIDVRSYSRSKDNSWNSFLPSMSLSGGIQSNAGIIDFGDGDVKKITDPGAFGFSTGIKLTLLLNTAIIHEIKARIVDYDAGLISYEDAKKKLERDVRKQFYLLLSNRENIQIQKNNIELAEKRLEQARNNFEHGLVQELDVLSAEVTLAGLQPTYNSTITEHERLMLFFKFLIGVDRNTEINLDGSLDAEVYQFDAENLIGKSISRRFDIRSLEKQIESLKLKKEVLRQNYNLPALTLDYTYGISGSNANRNNSYPPSPIEQWSNWADAGKLQITLGWRFDGLIPGSSSNIQIRRSQDAIDKLVLAKQMALESAAIEITNLVNRLETARKTIDASASNVELARRNFELTERAYNVGAREILDVDTSQQKYLEASQQLLYSRYEYIAELLNLEYELNTPIDELLDSK